MMSLNNSFLVITAVAIVNLYKYLLIKDGVQPGPVSNFSMGTGTIS